MYNQHKILRVLQLISLLKTKPAKTIRHLSEVLDSTERTVYRYLDLLAEVGFQISRDGFNRVFIDQGDQVQELVFTKEEMDLLQQLVQTVGSKSKFRDSLLKKLALHSEAHIHSNHLLKAHLAKIVEQLTSAIQSRRQTILKKYHSVSSNTISDRLVEPVCFTDNYQNLVAFEVKTGKNKYFNIERIPAVHITRRTFEHEAKHKFNRPDVFGFSEGERTYRVDLLLNVRAAVLLREEYPMTSALITRDKKAGTYRFCTRVNNLKAMKRFIRGMEEEITVLGGEELLAALSRKAR
ncbi:MAG: WYL domain-containing protein [Bacteroidia bacterium]|nr:WYL domain-containing protein [Bacteroidia bacterium]